MLSHILYRWPKITKKAFMALSLKRLPMKTEYHQVWISLHLEHVVGYLRWKLLPQIKKKSTITLLFKINLQWKPNTTQFASIFNLKMMPAFLMAALPEITKMVDLTWVQSEFMWVTSYRLNQTLRGGGGVNLIQWITTVKFFTLHYLL